MALVAHNNVNSLLTEPQHLDLVHYDGEGSSKKHKKKFRTFPLLPEGAANGKPTKDNPKQKPEVIDPALIANLVRTTIRSSKNLAFLQTFLDALPQSQTAQSLVPASQPHLHPRNMTTFPPPPGPLGNLSTPSQLWGLGTLGFALVLSYSPKTPQEDHRKQEVWAYQASVASIPHPSKKYKGGEDAYFISHHVYGIADGVGGWERHGIDPSLYSNKLMHEASLAAQELDDPASILQKAYDESHTVIGSSTACILTVKESKLCAANLGDSVPLFF